jgi:probable selenium-dependent hydroxylase accessory protein YqeC
MPEVPKIRIREALKLKGGGIVSLVGAGGKTSLMGALAKEFLEQDRPVLITTTTRIMKPEAEAVASVVIQSDAEKLTVACRDAAGRHGIVAAAAGYDETNNKLVGLSREVIDDLARSRLFEWIIVEADGAARRPIKAPAAHEPVIPAGTGWVIGLVGLRGVGKPLTDQWVFRLSRFQRLTGLRTGGIVSAPAVVSVLAHSRGLMKGAPDGARKMVFLNQADDTDRIRSGIQIASLLGSAPSGIESVVIGRLKPTPQVIECIDLKG